MVARAYLDQLQRQPGVQQEWVAGISEALGQAERLAGPEQRDALAAVATGIEEDARRVGSGERGGDPHRMGLLAQTLRQLSEGVR